MAKFFCKIIREWLVMETEINAFISNKRYRILNWDYAIKSVLKS